MLLIVLIMTITEVLLSDRSTRLTERPDMMQVWEIENSLFSKSNQSNNTQIVQITQLSQRPRCRVGLRSNVYAVHLRLIKKPV